MFKPKFNPVFLSFLLGVLVLSGCTPTTTVPTIEPPSNQQPVHTLTPQFTPSPALSPTHIPAHFETTDCKVFNIPENNKMECGYLSVPEDRTQPNSPMIQLAVAIISSSNSNPSPDPVVFLQGGPGAPALQMLGGFNVLYNVSPLYDFLAQRDLVMFDQRGTGYSLPSLNCPEWDNQAYADLSLNLTREEAQEHSIQVALACHDRLIQEGINLAAYTSAANAADVNDLRLALGYAKLNLYGISYGARLALTVMRDFPEGVQSVILDSVYPPQVAGNVERVSDAERAFNLLFARCAADTQCNAAYPELKAIFYDTVAQWDTNPITLALTHPTTGVEYEAVMNGDSLIGILFNLLYSTDALPILPRFIYDLHEGRVANIDSKLEQAINWIMFQSDFFSEGLYFSIQCGEEVNFISPKDVTTATAKAYPRLRDTLNSDLEFAICADWDAKRASAKENQPVVSDIPTLILAGDNDPITPAAWSQLTAQNLSNSLYFEFPWVGHGVWGAGLWGSCSRSIVSAFLDDPHSAPDSSCMKAMKVFFVTE